MQDTEQIVAALIGSGVILDLVLSHKQRAIYARFRNWKKWLADRRLAEVIDRLMKQVARYTDLVFGERVTSVRSILSGAILAAIFATAKTYFATNDGTPSGNSLLPVYLAGAIPSAIAGTCSYLASRVLLATLIRKTTLTRTLIVLIGELVIVKLVVLLFMSVVALASVAVLMFSVTKGIPAETTVKLVWAIILMLLTLGQLVILPASLAMTFVHIAVVSAGVALHLLTKASRYLELLLTGVLKTKRVAFSTTAAVVAAFLAIGNVCATHLHLLTWFQQFWSWQAELDMIVAHYATYGFMWLWFKCLIWFSK